jgi:hypothetical protein
MSRRWSQRAVVGAAGTAIWSGIQKKVIFEEAPGRILYEIEGRGLEGCVEIATGAWAVAQLHLRKRE